jgi:hypothetical protein
MAVMIVELLRFSQSWASKSILLTGSLVRTSSLVLICFSMTFCASCGGNGASTTTPATGAGGTNTGGTSTGGSTTSQPATIAISPTVAYVSPNTPLRFTATTTGVQNATIQWSALSTGVGVPIVANVIDANGTFLSSSIAQYQVQAAISGSSAVPAFATVFVASISAFPNPEFLLPGQKRKFTEALTGIPSKPLTTFDTSVNWSIAEGSAGGTIDSAGNYTAPAALGTYHVVVSSAPGPSITTTIPVTVLAHGFHSLPGTITPREDSHTATVLADGRVLIAGGRPADGTPVTNLAEIFDPATNTFSATGSMTTDRASHSATLLKSGKVLIVGGYDHTFTLTSVASSSAELYDPASGTFTRTAGSPVVTHQYHTATLLQDGKVLITGGDSLGFAELYDPASDSFSLTGNPIVPDGTDGSAILLANGKVLFVANNDPAELYDPVAGSFSPVVTNQCCQSRERPAVASLPDGDVIIFGADTPLSRGVAELYGLASNRIAVTTQPQVPGLDDVAATMLSNGTILKSGGGNGVQVGALAYAEIFDPSTFTFAFTGSMVEGRAYHILSLLPDGRVLSTGGFPGGLAEIWQ